MFQSRVREQAAALGYDAHVPDTAATLRDALAGAGLLVLDLHVTGIDWRDAVAAAQERGVPVLAFGRHTEASLLREARDLGCDRVVPRSELAEELSVILSEAKNLAARDPGAARSR
jgi:hypothetical protein